MADHYEKHAALAHEIWAAAQLAPGEGIADGVTRVEALLRKTFDTLRREWADAPSVVDEALGIVPEDGQEKGRE